MPNWITALIASLRATGIPFAIESWTDKPTGSAYGVLVPTSDTIVYASDSAAISVHNAMVYLYTFGDGYTDKAKVDNALANCDVAHLTGRQYVDKINAERWSWKVQVV